MQYDKSMKIAFLQNECKAKKISYGGTKAKLVERLNNYKSNESVDLHLHVSLDDINVEDGTVAATVVATVVVDEDQVIFIEREKRGDTDDDDEVDDVDDESDGVVEDTFELVSVKTLVIKTFIHVEYLRRIV